MRAQEDERVRIARELHDELGQQLTALRLVLERHRSECAAGASALEDALILTRRADAQLDLIAWELRPASLDALGLRAALRELVRRWVECSGIHASFRCASTQRLPAHIELAIYRVAQEALHNVLKHARATRVDVSLVTAGGCERLVVSDDGTGFEPATRSDAASGAGLVGMYERAALVGGSLELDSAPGGGTRVVLRCPIQRAR